MIILDQPPPIWVPAKPAIIRPADPALLAMPIFLTGIPTVFHEPCTATFQTSLNSTVSGTAHTFTAATVGTAFARRKIVVAIGASRFGAATLNSVTIGGVTATRLVQNDNNVDGVYTVMAIAELETGTTATIVCTYSAAMTDCGIGIWSVQGMRSETAFDTATDFVANQQNKSITIDIPSGGCLIAARYFIDNTDTVNWINATERYDNVQNVNTRKTGADNNNTGAQQTNLVVQANMTGTPLTAGTALWGVSWR